MRILNVSQALDTQAWLDARLGRITGTKAGALSMEHYAQKDVDKLIAMADKAKTEEKAQEYREKAEQARLDNMRLKVPADFWQFLAEVWAEQPDGEPPMERGHRLENENIIIACNKLNIPTENVTFDTGMWLSDVDERIAVSPDAHENSATPTFAFEAKSLGTKYHLAAVVPFAVRQALDDTNTEEVWKTKLHNLALQLFPEALTMERVFDFLPSQYQAQVLQYFVVDDNLETVYFTMYDDRVYGSLRHMVFPVTRESVAEDVANQRASELDTLHMVDDLKPFGGVEW